MLKETNVTDKADRVKFKGTMATSPVHLLTHHHNTRLEQTFI